MIRDLPVEDTSKRSERAGYINMNNLHTQRRLARINSPLKLTTLVMLQAKLKEMSSPLEYPRTCSAGH